MLSSERIGYNNCLSGLYVLMVGDDQEFISRIKKKLKDKGAFVNSHGDNLMKVLNVLDHFVPTCLVLVDVSGDTELMFRERLENYPSCSRPKILLISRVVSPFIEIESNDDLGFFAKGEERLPEKIIEKLISLKQGV